MRSSSALRVWGAAQRLHLALQPRDAHGRLHQHLAVGQRGACGLAEGAGLQCVQRQHAPGLAVHPQAHAHAIVHGQGLAHQGVEQAVVGVGQGAVVVEAGHLAPRQDGREPGVLADHKAPAQRLAHQTLHGHGAQVVFFQLQQGHGAAVKAGAQVVHQPLQAHGLGQVGGQVGQQGAMVHGDIHLKWVN